MKKLILFFKHLFGNTFKYKNLILADLDNWKSIYEGPIKHANLSRGKIIVLAQSTYIAKLEQSLVDLILTKQEKEQLEEIIKYFSLDISFVNSVKASINKTATEKLVKKKYEDKILTDDEKEEIVEFATYLNLNPIEIEKIRLNVASALFSAVVSEKLSDHKLTPQEETDLIKTLNNLQIDISVIKEIIPTNKIQELAYAKLLWQLSNGIFPVLQNVALGLKKNENCYLSFSSRLLERKVVTTGYSSSSSGVSFRIAKGVSYRVGASRSRAIKEEVTLKHPGMLYLTNERVIFVSSGKHSFTLKFDKILSFEVYSDGMSFILEKKNHLIELDKKHVELYATGLSSAIRNYLDDENTYLANAQKEIESNESFIRIEQ
jgi:hypothetical protein